MRSERVEHEWLDDDNVKFIFEDEHETVISFAGVDINDLNNKLEKPWLRCGRTLINMSKVKYIMIKKED